MLAVVDVGPLYAAADAADPDHARSLGALETSGMRLVVPALVAGEVARLVASRMGARVEAELLKGLSEMDVEGPTPDDFLRMSELLRRHPSLGAPGAMVVAVCERLRCDLVVTLEAKRFAPVRARVGALRFLPS